MVNLMHSDKYMLENHMIIQQQVFLLVENQKTLLIRSQLLDLDTNMVLDLYMKYSNIDRYL